MSWDDSWQSNQDGWQDGGWSGDGNGGAPRRRRRGVWLALAALPVLLVVGLLLAARNRGGQADGAPTPTASPNPLVAAATIAPAATTSPAATASPEPETPASSPTFGPNGAASVIHDEAINTLALELINESRRAAGLQPVLWDAVAAEAGERHVVEMVEWGYFSHWNLDGLGPEHRYSRVGGVNAVMENLHARASVRPPDDWGAVIREAHAGLMDSPGHRANILDPAHTHVGIAIAYDASAGQVRLAQEFTNQYVVLNRWLPLSAERGARILVDGSIANPNIDNILLDVAWEPIPQPLSVEQLNQTSSYSGAAQSFNTMRIERGFSQEVALDNV